MELGHSRLTPKQVLSVQFNWMIRRDMVDVLRIERESFDFNWTEEDFLACLRQPNCIGMVAEADGHVVGYMIYEWHKARLHILNFAVSPLSRRVGVGTQMIDKLVRKLSQQRRQEIVVTVRETNLPAQLFFQTQGFRATGVLRNHYHDSDEAGYTMRYALGNANMASPVPSQSYSVKSG